MAQLPSLSGVPPRFLRSILGCTALGLTLLSLWRFSSSWPQHGLQDLVASTNFTTNDTTKQIWAPWTTEQLIPRFAYAQYATNLDYLCNAVINFHLLKNYGAQYDLVLIHPKGWNEGDSREANALAAIRKSYPEILLRGFDVISTRKGDSTWADSLTKFHSFALTNWTRVLAFDSDSLVLNNMDHYFLSPMASVAVPRAYWLNDRDANLGQQVLGSHVMLIEPDQDLYGRVLDEARESGDFDMEVINHIFKDSALILPHRRLALLTGEFRAHNHSKYLGSSEHEEWNAMAEVSRSFLVHFSDWPLPKPWLRRSKAQWEASLPECDDEVGSSDRPPCADRLMWTSFYDDYDMHKLQQCAPLF